MPNNVSFGVQAKGVSKASSELDNLRDKFDKLQKQGARGFAIGAAAGATTFALGAMREAVSQVGDVLESAKDAALQDEASIVKLNAAIKANVKSWDGNTDAIERVIKSRMALGFTDEDQRDSLARLVAATHDVNKALELERTAMDLAAFKGVDLATASQALITISGGQYRALKQLIGSTKDIKTSEEALAAVRMAAGGQAAARAASDAGKVEAAHIREGEALEKLGYTILPAYVAAVEVAANVVDDLAGNLEGLNKAAAAAGPVFEMLGVKQKGAADGGFDLVHAGQDLLAVMNPTKVSNTLGVFMDTADKLGVSTEAARESFAGFGLEVNTQFSTINQLADRGADNMSHYSGEVVGAVQDVGDAADGMAKDVGKDTKSAAKSFGDLRDSMATDAQSMIDDYFDPIEQRAALHQTRLSLFAAERARANAKTVEDQRQAASDIVDALDEEASGLAKLGAKGKLTNKDIDKFAKDAEKNYSHLSKDARAKIQAIIAKLRELVAIKAVEIKVQANLATAGNKERATGGPVRKGEAYIVGEKRPEVFVPTENGTIVPNISSFRGSQGGSVAAPPPSSSVTFHVTVNAGIGSGLTAGDARKLADTIGPAIYADMQRKGYLPRATGLR